MRKSLLRTLTLALILVPGAFLSLSFVVADNIPNRVYELRTYTATEGNLDKLNARFRNHTTRIFLKHGMQVVGFWTPTDEPEASNTLIYILSHASQEQAEENWKAFAADPDWQKVAEESNADGRILAKVERKWMSATDYSPMK